MEFVHSLRNPSAPMAFCSFEAMHTAVELLFVCDEEARARALCDSVQELFARLERVFSRHLPDAELSRLNATLEPFEAGDELYFALELCEQLRLATKGYFDIAALSPTLHRPAYSTLPPVHKVQRRSGDIMLDMGGFGKGFALEKAKKLLVDGGIASAILNAGNSSVLAIGRHPLGDCWKVSPEKDGSTEFRLLDSALSVSGVAGFGRGHIVDPKTGKTVSKDRNVAVTGRSALVCEVLSTALYAAPAELHAGILESFGNYEKHEIKQ